MRLASSREREAGFGLLARAYWRARLLAEDEADLRHALEDRAQVCGRSMRQPWVGEVVAERLELQPREVEDLGEKSVGHVVTRDWLVVAAALHEVVVQVSHVDRMNHQLAEPQLGIFR